MEIVKDCDLCGASLDGVPPVAGLEALPLVACPGCGLVVTSPRPGPGEIAAFYPDDYYAHVRPAPRRGARFVAELKARRGGYPSTDGALARAAWRLAAETVGRLYLTHLPYAGPGRRLLDVGCGVGQSLVWAAERGWEVHGVELDPEAVRLAHDRGLASVRLGTLEAQGFPAERFDAITLYQTLEHVYSPRAVLSECRRILRPGGRLLVSVPNFASLPRETLGGAWNGMQLPVHLYHFTEPTLRRLATSCGLEVEEVRYNAAPVALLTNVRHSLRTARRTGSGARQALRLLARAIAPAWRRGARINDIMLLSLRRPGAS